jgi:serine/threonine-protein kinase
MAEVHVGRDTRLGRTVAIKLLRSDLARDPSFQTRFRREAQAAASLNHPAIVSVYDTGEDVTMDAQGATRHVPFIIMEYVEGHTLRELMHDGAALPIDEATDITIGVLSALQYAHHAGIVHRDIKPGNIMLTTAGQVKVMDFGIARALTETSDAVTQTQAVIGTAQYLSPEQARGENVDARSDLYSTGCVLFELLTGRPPFVGDTALSIAYQHVREFPAPPSAYAPDVPAALDQVVMKALAKHRDQRYSTASEFLADLQAFKHGGRVSAPVVAGGASPEATQVIAPAPVGGALGGGMASFPPPGSGGPPLGPGGAFQNAGILPPTEQVEEEEAADAAKRKRLIIIWSIVGGVVALILIGLGLFALLSGDKEPDPGGQSTPVQVRVPQVPASGTVEDSIEALKAANLKAEEGTPERSDTVELGKVIRFDPRSGRDVEAGSVVKYIVSLGANAVTVPPTENKTQEEARAELTALNLKVAGTTKSVNSPTVAIDRVVGTEPAVGQVVKPGDEIVLLISNGKTTVPDCTGKTQQECSTALQEAGLVLAQFREEESDETEGSILRTEPPFGNTVDQKTPVVVVVAKAADIKVLPNFAGWTEDAARSWLDGAGLSAYAETEPSTTLAAGLVISSDPPANTSVKRGDTVRLRVSAGPGPSSPSPTSVSKSSNQVLFAAIGAVRMLAV